MRTYIHTFDCAGNGYITEKDYTDISRRFADGYGVNDERKENIIQVFSNAWRKLMKAGDIETDGRLTASILIESVKQQMYDPGLIIEFSHLIRGLHGFMDINKDGYLQLDDFQTYFEKCGVPEETFDRKFAFEAIDANGDGKISSGEFCAAWFDFLFSQDESSPNKFFFGQLVD